MNKHADQPILNITNPLHYKLAVEFIKALHRAKAGLVVFDVHRLKDWRTLSQNAYMHGVVFVAAARGMTEAWGRDVTMYEAKDFLKDRYLRVPIVNGNGEEVGSRTRSTAELDKAECSWFIERCIEFCADDLNVEVPSADEYLINGGGDEYRNPLLPHPGDLQTEPNPAKVHPGDAPPPNDDGDEDAPFEPVG